ncbi:hypothetical protein [Microbacterium elymi]|uniref:Uncharacterized protein n=1 Tax=Microbacterium elymi TaxID=2909587 RepID=A0ABY5NM67_9MICO|nr:hypothetical protein [Microbacterium elymi]UUT36289.1 hypothetical protein L2X98_25300 [Microbacterium elymi]
MADRRMTEERWQRATYWPLMAISLVWLVAYSWQVIADLSGPDELVARGITGVTWALFLVDYVVRLVLADPRGSWFRHHLFDLAVVALPLPAAAARCACSPW